MAYCNVEKTLVITSEYLESTECKEWKLEQNTIEWYRDSFRVKMSLEEGSYTDLEELLTVRKGCLRNKESDIWYACFEVFPGIAASRPYQRQTAEYCESIKLDPCFVQLGFDTGELVIKAAFPIIENPISSCTLHLVEHVSSQIIEAYGDTIDALAHGHFPFSIGRTIAIPSDARPVSMDVLQKTSEVIRSFLKGYEAHSFTIEREKNGLPYWKSVVQLGREKVVSCISFTETGLLKTEMHLDPNSRPLHPRQRNIAAQMFQYEWEDKWPAFAWYGSDEEPPMVYAYVSLLDGEISEKTLVELENNVALAYDGIIEVALPVIKGTSPDRHIKYIPQFHARDLMSRMERFEHLQTDGVDGISTSDDDKKEIWGDLLDQSHDNFGSGVPDGEKEVTE